MKRIGILGSGVVAKALGTGFLKYGYPVMMGTRDTSKLDSWKKTSGAKSEIGSFKETAQFADVIVLAVRGESAIDAITLAGIENLSGKIVIDTCNPIDHNRPAVHGVLHYFTGLDDSLMERLQLYAPDARFVKAFNCVGNRFMVDPGFPDGKPTMFICGNDLKAKTEVTAILDQFGWETEDMGMVEAARAIEPLCILWCIPGINQSQWNHAFKLLKLK